MNDKLYVINIFGQIKVAITLNLLFKFASIFNSMPKSMILLSHRYNLLCINPSLANQS